MKRFSWLAILFVIAMAGCSVLPVSPLKLDNAVEASNVEATVAAPAQAAAPAQTEPITSGDALAALESRLEAIYEQVNPSVVNIKIEKKVDVGTIDIPGFFSSPFSQTPQEPQVVQGAGSGFVWDDQGHIVTNNHVVDSADKITVVFSDGTTVPAEVVGTDVDSDLAVIKVDVPSSSLAPVQMAKSADLKVGQLAVAIGNPFALEGTMTVGFISALGRQLPVNNESGPAYQIPDIIQTDAPINPGNSGGVLVNDQGQVIGVTAAIESNSQDNAGIGFAIPSDIVQKVVPALIDTGSYDHTYIGISGESLVPELSKAMDLDANQRGVLVVEVTPNSPADKADIRGSDRQIEIEGSQALVGGDVIVAIDEQPVKEFDDLITYLARSTEVGQVVKLTVLRDGKEQVVELTLAARPGQDNTTAEEQSGEPEIGAAWLGVQGMTLTPAIASAMGLDKDQEGVLVQQLVQGSPADKAGLNGSFKKMTIDGEDVMIGGDVITAFNGDTVKSFEDLASHVAKAEPNEKVDLSVLRDGKKITVTCTLAERPTE